jgi:RNA polymerase sigma-70 factor (ECF subfamily)
MRRLSAHYESEDRRRVFEVIKPCLTGDDPESYAILAKQLGSTEGAVRVSVHRMRRTYREALREVIRDTVDRAEDVDDELRHLMNAVSR